MAGGFLCRDCTSRHDRGVGSRNARLDASGLERREGRAARLGAVHVRPEEEARVPRARARDGGFAFLK